MNRRVDQKLHLAKLALGAIDANSFAETALAEAALFHLHIAYRAYLHELLDHFKLVMSVDSAQAAADFLREKKLCSADIDELAKLEQSGDWPAQIHAAYVAAMNIEVEPVSVASAGIAMRDVTTQIDGRVCAAWLRQFQALLQRQREHAQEW